MLKSIEIPIAASVTVSLNNLAREKAKKEQVHNFAAGDPVIACHPSIMMKAKESLNLSYHMYPPVKGVLELRELLIHWYNEEYGAYFEIEDTLVTCGGKMALSLSLQALLRPGDEALILSPYWVSYPDIVRLFQGVPKIVNTTPEKNWKVTVEDLKKALTVRTKVLIINSANNPTGTLYTKEELKSILQFAKENRIVVISDEVYSEIVFDGHRFVSCSSFEEFKDDVIIIQSCSKNFGMTGWRVGFALAPKEFINVIAVLQSQSLTAAPFICQKAAIGALEKRKEVSGLIQEEIRKRRDLFLLEFTQRFGVSLQAPVSSMYVFVSLKDLGIDSMDSVWFCEEVLKKGNVSCIPGIAFGQQGYVRFAFSESEKNIQAGIEALQKACKIIRSL